MPLSAPPASHTEAVERYLTGAGIAKSSARIYQISLTTWGVTSTPSYGSTGEPQLAWHSGRGSRSPTAVLPAGGRAR